MEQAAIDGEGPRYVWVVINRASGMLWVYATMELALAKINGRRGYVWIVEEVRTSASPNDRQPPQPR
jgi:hypothetical protein